MRYILLDRITMLQPPELARGVKCVSLSDDCFADHFPGHPIMPGALILESLAQLAGVLLEATMREQRGPQATGELHALLTMIDRAKFRHVVRPGDKLELEARGLRATEDGGQAQGFARLDGQLVAEAQLSFAFANVTNPAMLARRREFLAVWLTGSAGTVTRRPVFVRGVGAFSPLGPTWTTTANQLAEGACGIAPITSFDAAGFPCTHAASIADDHTEEDRRLGFARHAAREAWKMAALTIESPRLGVFLGAESGRGRFGTVLGLSRAARAAGKFDHAKFGREARVFAERIDASVISPSAVAAALAGDYNAGGPVETISLACASGSAAIVEGARAIRLGQIDVALCGGVGADVDPLMLAGFGLLGILSPRGISCPFDAQRDGFIIGEGAAMLVLSADRGNAAVELAGLGRSLDAHHLTAPDPEGDGAYRAMTAALRDANVDAVDYVQAHGTSTPLNDAIEVAAIKRALGANVDRAHVSSSKGALGHWVAGAGALGALFAWEAIVRSRVLPTAGLADPDPRCDVNHVIGRALDKRCSVALANAFAFGGANSCLVMRGVA